MIKTIRVFLFISALVVFNNTGCRKENLTEELSHFVWEYASLHPDGFTLDLSSKTTVSSGIVVAFEATQNSFGRESLNSVIDHALNHDKIVGGWLNESDSQYYFDSNRLFANGMYEEAKAFAVANNQLAIYDLSNDSVIWIEYPAGKIHNIDQKKRVFPLPSIPDKYRNGSNKIRQTGFQQARAS